MKTIATLLLAGCLMISSCGIVLQGGKTTPCQKLQKTEQVKRKYRWGLITVDLLLGVIPAIVDLQSGAAYKKETSECSKK